MAKTEVYSWRLSPELKMGLETAARREGRSLADLLEDISRRWLDESRSAEDGEQQARLHAVARRFAGSIEIADPDLSTKVRQRVRDRLRRRHAG